jgi:hypothetical protein
MSTNIPQTSSERDNAILASRGIPLSFHKWSYSVWNKTQLLYCIKALGGDELMMSPKRHLFERLNQLRPASTPLSEQELDTVRRIRREGKTSTRSSALDASIRPTSLLERKVETDQNSSQSANTQASTDAQYQKTEECEVCADTITPELRLTQAITQDCTHPAQIAICKTCVEHHIHVQIDSVGWDGVRCPVQACYSIFNYNDLRNMASSADFERYDAHIFQNAMRRESGSGYRQCAHPTCTGGGWCNPDTESFMTCPACVRQTCIECNVIWHTDKTCAEYKEEVRIQKENEDAEEAAARAAAEAESVKYVQENYKACPNKNCGYRIEKNGGCDHMTCRKCRHEFCWICDADYREIRQNGNHAHKGDCRYHSDQLGHSLARRPPVMPA